MANREKTTKKRKKITVIRIFWILFGVFMLGAAAVEMITLVIISSTASRVYEDTGSMAKNDVALVLGTAKFMPDGRLNLFFKYRIEAAAKLYHEGKVEHILVSGGNPTIGYDEPTDMAGRLVEMGVAKDDITLDFAGYRTLDSIVRAKEVFGLKGFTIVSQKFHNYRAIFLADHYELDTVAYNARTPRCLAAVKAIARDHLARVKAILDIYILDTQPRYSGPKEPIIVD